MDNSVTAICAIIEEDRRVTFPAVPGNLQENHFIEISQGSLHTIIHEHLNLSKLSTDWTLKSLIEDHCTKSMVTALHFLSIYYEFGLLLKQIITSNKRWVYFYTPKTKTQLMQ